MILRTDTNTFTADHENATADPLFNSNTAITIGGMVKTQIDSRRLSITSQIRIKQSDLASLNAVLEDYSQQMYYTPNCKLYDRTTIEEIEVVMKGNPTIDQRIYYDDKVFYITFTFEEVLTS